MKQKLILFIIAVCASFQLVAQNHEISFKIGSYTNDTLIIGYYYGEKQLVKDTVFATKKGEFNFVSNGPLEPGMYIALLKPDNSFIQFIVSDEEKKYEVAFDKADIYKVNFKNSKENKRFYDYVDFLKDKNKTAQPMRDSLSKWKEAGKDDPKLKAELDKLDAEVSALQKKIMNENPTSFTARLIEANIDITIPEFEGTEDEVKMKKYRFYKTHYFDNVHWDDPSLIRTPYIFQKTDFYINKLTVQNPDSIIPSVKEILTKTEKNEEAFKYYLSHFLNTYANSKIIGMDKIFVYLVDNYYAKGKAPWTKEENLKKILESADNLRNVLIGEIFPNITTYKEDNTPVTIHNIKSPYTLVIIWAPDCGHCKKAMPDIVKFAEDWKTKGVEVVTICAKGGDKANTCWEGVKEKHMENLINTGDVYQRYRQILKFQSTPKVYLLDEKKEIIFKDMPAEELDKIMNEIIKVEEEKKKKASKS